MTDSGHPDGAQTGNVGEIQIGRRHHRIIEPGCEREFQPALAIPDPGGFKLDRPSPGRPFPDAGDQTDDRSTAKVDVLGRRGEPASRADGAPTGIVCNQQNSEFAAKRCHEMFRDLPQRVHAGLRERTDTARLGLGQLPDRNLRDRWRARRHNPAARRGQHGSEQTGNPHKPARESPASAGPPPIVTTTAQRYGNSQFHAHVYCRRTTRPIQPTPKRNRAIRRPGRRIRARDGLDETFRPGRRTAGNRCGAVRTAKRGREAQPAPIREPVCEPSGAAWYSPALVRAWLLTSPESRCGGEGRPSRLK